VIEMYFSFFRILNICLIMVLAGLIFEMDVRAQSNGTSRADHVILISLDGFRPDFYQQERWPAPMLQKMAREGVQADGVRGIFPTRTYPSHTTLVTGVYPNKHQIYNNTIFNPESETTRWYFYYEEIKAKTIWDLVNENGGVTANVGWPVTVGAPIDYNVVISGALQGSGLSEDPIRDFTTPEGLFEELEREATGKLDLRYDLSNSNPAKENRVAEMVSYILKKHKPQLITVALQTADSHQHQYGREHPHVDRAVAAVDRALARIVEAVERAGILDRTAFVISGDHGFADYSVSVSPNVWLVEAGLMEARDDRGNWRAAFQAGGGSAFLFLRDPNDHEAERKVREILENLPEPTQKLFSIVERDKLDLIGADPRVPFALTANPVAIFSGALSGDPLRAVTGGTHGHFPDFRNMEIGFVAWGAGVRKSVQLPQIGLEDVAPFTASLLGLTFPDTDGLLIPGLLD
jgi:predicted AlkP superfamily pyrophosphatase or phosphodiesterase